MYLHHATCIDTIHAFCTYSMQYTQLLHHAVFTVTNTLFYKTAKYYINQQNGSRMLKYRHKKICKKFLVPKAKKTFYALGPSN